MMKHVHGVDEKGPLGKRPDMNRPSDPDFGKVRVYECSCGRRTVTSLNPVTVFCGHCVIRLDGRPFVVEDHLRFTERMTGRVKGE